MTLLSIERKQKFLSLSRTCLTRKLSKRKGKRATALVYSRAKFREKFELVVQGHPKSSTLVPIKSAYATFLLVISITLVVSRTAFEIPTHKTGKWHVFPTTPLFDAHTLRNPCKYPHIPYISRN